MHAGTWNYSYGGLHECVLGHKHDTDLNIFIVRHEYYIRHVTFYVGEA